jgi:hypothetical protein
MRHAANLQLGLPLVLGRQLIFCQLAPASINSAETAVRSGVIFATHTVLDDPLQSLDSMNLLGLVDVLRRFRAHCQIILSTREERWSAFTTQAVARGQEDCDNDFRKLVPRGAHHAHAVL